MFIEYGCHCDPEYVLGATIHLASGILSSLWIYWVIITILKEFSDHFVFKFFSNALIHKIRTDSQQWGM